jgi:predicted transcriptional regulator
MPLIDADRLRYEMAVRGLTAGDLARMAGIDANTLTRALHGRPVTMRTVRMITSTLLAQPHVPMTVDLIVKPGGRALRDKSESGRS